MIPPVSDMLANDVCGNGEFVYGAGQLVASGPSPGVVPMNGCTGIIAPVSRASIGLFWLYHRVWLSERFLGGIRSRNV